MVTVLPRFLFWALLKRLDITDSNVEEQSNRFFISINSTEGNDNEPYFKGKHNNVLTLFFDDCDEYRKHPVIGSPGDYYEQIPMSDEQALMVMDFIQRMDEKSEVFVHCTAGVSRSGAVGAYINDYFGRDWGEFLRRNPQVIPNSHISSLFKKLSYQQPF
jgi:predicted protein tyrosine phosphatase